MKVFLGCKSYCDCIGQVLVLVERVLSCSDSVCSFVGLSAHKASKVMEVHRSGPC